MTLHLFQGRVRSSDQLTSLPIDPARPAKNRIWVFASNDGHHIPGNTPFTFHDGSGQAAAAAMLHGAEIPSLGLPTVFGREQQVSDEGIVQSAIHDLARVIGFSENNPAKGFDIVLPVRKYQEEGDFFKKPLCGFSNDTYAKALGKSPIDLAEHFEPSLWGAINTTPNYALSSYYNDFCSLLIYYFNGNVAQKAQALKFLNSDFPGFAQGFAQGQQDQKGDQSWYQSAVRSPAGSPVGSPAGSPVRSPAGSLGRSPAGSLVRSPGAGVKMGSAPAAFSSPSPVNLSVKFSPRRGSAPPVDRTPSPAELSSKPSLRRDSDSEVAAASRHGRVADTAIRALSVVGSGSSASPASADVNTSTSSSLELLARHVASRSPRSSVGSISDLDDDSETIRLDDLDDLSDDDSAPVAVAMNAQELIWSLRDLVRFNQSADLEEGSKEAITQQTLVYLNQLLVSAEQKSLMVLLQQCVTQEAIDALKEFQILAARKSELKTRLEQLQLKQQQAGVAEVRELFQQVQQVDQQVQQLRAKTVDVLLKDIVSVRSNIRYVMSDVNPFISEKEYLTRLKTAQKEQEHNPFASVDPAFAVMQEYHYVRLQPYAFAKNVINAQRFELHSRITALREYIQIKQKELDQVSRNADNADAAAKASRGALLDTAAEISRLTKARDALDALELYPLSDKITQKLDTLVGDHSELRRQTGRSIAAGRVRAEAKHTELSAKDELSGLQAALARLQLQFDSCYKTATADDNTAIREEFNYILTHDLLRRDENINKFLRKYLNAAGIPSLTGEFIVNSSSGGIAADKFDFACSLVQEYEMQNKDLYAKKPVPQLTASREIIRKCAEDFKRAVAKKPKNPSEILDLAYRFYVSLTIYLHEEKRQKFSSIPDAEHLNLGASFNEAAKEYFQEQGGQASLDELISQLDKIFYSDVNKNGMHNLEKASVLQVLRVSKVLYNIHPNKFDELYAKLTDFYGDSFWCGQEKKLFANVMQKAYSSYQQDRQTSGQRNPMAGFTFLYFMRQYKKRYGYYPLEFGGFEAVDACASEFSQMQRTENFEADVDLFIENRAESEQLEIKRAVQNLQQTWQKAIEQSQQLQTQFLQSLQYDTRHGHLLPLNLLDCANACSIATAQVGQLQQDAAEAAQAMEQVQPLLGDNGNLTQQDIKEVSQQIAASMLNYFKSYFSGGAWMPSLVQRLIFVESIFKRLNQLELINPLDFWGSDGDEVAGMSVCSIFNKLKLQQSLKPLEWKFLTYHLQTAKALVLSKVAPASQQDLIEKMEQAVKQLAEMEGYLVASNSDFYSPVSLCVLHPFARTIAEVDQSRDKVSRVSVDPEITFQSLAATSGLGVQSKKPLIEDFVVNQFTDPFRGYVAFILANGNDGQLRELSNLFKDEIKKFSSEFTFDLSGKHCFWPTKNLNRDGLTQALNQVTGTVDINEHKPFHLFMLSITATWICFQHIQTKINQYYDLLAKGRPLLAEEVVELEKLSDLQKLYQADIADFVAIFNKQNNDREFELVNQVAAQVTGFMKGLRVENAKAHVAVNAIGRAMVEHGGNVELLQQIYPVQVFKRLQNVMTSEPLFSIASVFKQLKSKELYYGVAAKDRLTHAKKVFELYLRYIYEEEKVAELVSEFETSAQWGVLASFIQKNWSTMPPGYMEELLEQIEEGRVILQEAKDKVASANFAVDEFCDDTSETTAEKIANFRREYPIDALVQLEKYAADQNFSLPCVNFVAAFLRQISAPNFIFDDIVIVYKFYHDYLNAYAQLGSEHQQALKDFRQLAPILSADKIDLRSLTLLLSKLYFLNIPKNYDFPKFLNAFYAKLGAPQASPAEVQFQAGAAVNWIVNALAGGKHSSIPIGESKYFINNERSENNAADIEVVLNYALTEVPVNFRDITRPARAFIQEKFLDYATNFKGDQAAPINYSLLQLIGFAWSKVAGNQANPLVTIAIKRLIAQRDQQLSSDDVELCRQANLLDPKSYAAQLNAYITGELLKGIENATSFSQELQNRWRFINVYGTYEHSEAFLKKIKSVQVKWEIISNYVDAQDKLTFCQNIFEEQIAVYLDQPENGESMRFLQDRAGDPEYCAEITTLILAKSEHAAFKNLIQKVIAPAFDRLNDANREKVLAAIDGDYFSYKPAFIIAYLNALPELNKPLNLIERFKVSLEVIFNEADIQKALSDLYVRSQGSAAACELVLEYGTSECPAVVDVLCKNLLQTPASDVTKIIADFDRYFGTIVDGYFVITGRENLMSVFDRVYQAAIVSIKDNVDLHLELKDLLDKLAWFQIEPSLIEDSRFLEMSRYLEVNWLCYVLKTRGNNDAAEFDFDDYWASLSEKIKECSGQLEQDQANYIVKNLIGEDKLAAVVHHLTLWQANNPEFNAYDFEQLNCLNQINNAVIFWLKQPENAEKAAAIPNVQLYLSSKANDTQKAILANIFKSLKVDANLSVEDFVSLMRQADQEGCLNIALSYVSKAVEGAMAADSLDSRYCKRLEEIAQALIPVFASPAVADTTDAQPVLTKEQRQAETDRNQVAPKCEMLVAALQDAKSIKQNYQVINQAYKKEIVDGVLTKRATQPVAKVAFVNFVTTAYKLSFNELVKFITGLSAQQKIELIRQVQSLADKVCKGIVDGHPLLVRLQTLQRMLNPNLVSFNSYALKTYGDLWRETEIYVNWFADVVERDQPSSTTPLNSRLYGEIERCREIINRDWQDVQAQQKALDDWLAGQENLSDELFALRNKKEPFKTMSDDKRDALIAKKEAELEQWLKQHPKPDTRDLERVQRQKQYFNLASDSLTPSSFTPIGGIAAELIQVALETMPAEGADHATGIAATLSPFVNVPTEAGLAKKFLEQTIAEVGQALVARNVKVCAELNGYLQQLQGRVLDNQSPIVQSLLTALKNVSSLDGVYAKIRALETAKDLVEIADSCDFSHDELLTLAYGLSDQQRKEVLEIISRRLDGTSLEPIGQTPLQTRLKLIREQLSYPTSVNPANIDQWNKTQSFVKLYQACSGYQSVEQIPGIETLLQQAVQSHNYNEAIPGGIATQLFAILWNKVCDTTNDSETIKAYAELAKKLAAFVRFDHSADHFIKDLVSIVRAAVQASQEQQAQVLADFFEGLGSTLTQSAELTFWSKALQEKGKIPQQLFVVYDEIAKYKATPKKNGVTPTMQLFSNAFAFSIDETLQFLLGCPKGNIAELSQHVDDLITNANLPNLFVRRLRALQVILHQINAGASVEVVALRTVIEPVWNSTQALAEMYRVFQQLQNATEQEVQAASAVQAILAITDPEFIALAKQFWLEQAQARSLASLGYLTTRMCDHFVGADLNRIRDANTVLERGLPAPEMLATNDSPNRDKDYHQVQVLPHVEAIVKAYFSADLAHRQAFVEKLIATIKEFLSDQLISALSSSAVNVEYNKFKYFYEILGALQGVLADELGQEFIVACNGMVQRIINYYVEQASPFSQTFWGSNAGPRNLSPTERARTKQLFLACRSVIKGFGSEQQNLQCDQQLTPIVSFYLQHGSQPNVLQVGHFSHGTFEAMLFGQVSPDSIRQQLLGTAFQSVKSRDESFRKECAQRAIGENLSVRLDQRFLALYPYLPDLLASIRDEVSVRARQWQLDPSLLITSQNLLKLLESLESQARQPFASINRRVFLTELKEALTTWNVLTKYSTIKLMEFDTLLLRVAYEVTTLNTYFPGRYLLFLDSLPNVPGATLAGSYVYSNGKLYFAEGGHFVHVEIDRPQAFDRNISAWLKQSSTAVYLTHDEVREGILQNTRFTDVEAIIINKDDADYNLLADVREGGVKEKEAYVVELIASGNIEQAATELNQLSLICTAEDAAKLNFDSIKNKIDSFLFANDVLLVNEPKAWLVLLNSFLALTAKGQPSMHAGLQAWADPMLQPGFIVNLSKTKRLFMFLTKLMRALTGEATLNAADVCINFGKELQQLEIPEEIVILSKQKDAYSNIEPLIAAIQETFAYSKKLQTLLYELKGPASEEESPQELKGATSKKPPKPPQELLAQISKELMLLPERNFIGVIDSDSKSKFQTAFRLATRAIKENKPSEENEEVAKEFENLAKRHQYPDSLLLAEMWSLSIQPGEYLAKLNTQMASAFYDDYLMKRHQKSMKIEVDDVNGGTIKAICENFARKLSADDLSRFLTFREWFAASLSAGAYSYERRLTPFDAVGDDNLRDKVGMILFMRSKAQQILVKYQAQPVVGMLLLEDLVTTQLNELKVLKSEERIGKSVSSFEKNLDHFALLLKEANRPYRTVLRRHQGGAQDITGVYSNAVKNVLVLAERVRPDGQVVLATQLRNYKAERIQALAKKAMDYFNRYNSAGCKDPGADFSIATDAFAQLVTLSKIMPDLFKPAEEAELQKLANQLMDCQSLQEKTGFKNTVEVQTIELLTNEPADWLNNRIILNLFARRIQEKNLIEWSNQHLTSTTDLNRDLVGKLADLHAVLNAQPINIPLLFDSVLALKQYFLKDATKQNYLLILLIAKLNLAAVAGEINANELIQIMPSLAMPELAIVLDRLPEVLAAKDDNVNEQATIIMLRYNRTVKGSAERKVFDQFFDKLFKAHQRNLQAILPFIKHIIGNDDNPLNKLLGYLPDLVTRVVIDPVPYKAVIEYLWDLYNTAVQKNKTQAAGSLRKFFIETRAFVVLPMSAWDASAEVLTSEKLLSAGTYFNVFLTVSVPQAAELFSRLLNLVSESAYTTATFAKTIADTSAAIGASTELSDDVKQMLKNKLSIFTVEVFMQKPLNTRSLDELAGVFTRVNSLWPESVLWSMLKAAVDKLASVTDQSRYRTGFDGFMTLILSQPAIGRNLGAIKLLQKYSAEMLKKFDMNSLISALSKVTNKSEFQPILVCYLDELSSRLKEEGAVDRFKEKDVKNILIGVKDLLGAYTSYFTAGPERDQYLLKLWNLLLLVKDAKKCQAEDQKTIIAQLFQVIAYSQPLQQQQLRPVLLEKLIPVLAGFYHELSQRVSVVPLKEVANMLTHMISYLRDVHVTQIPADFLQNLIPLLQAVIIKQNDRVDLGHADQLAKEDMSKLVAALSGLSETVQIGQKEAVVSLMEQMTKAQSDDAISARYAYDRAGSPLKS